MSNEVVVTGYRQNETQDSLKNASKEAIAMKYTIKQFSDVHRSRQSKLHSGIMLYSQLSQLTNFIIKYGKNVASMLL